MASQNPLSLLEEERRRSPGKNDAVLVADIAARLVAELGVEPPIPLEFVASFRDIADIQVVAMEQAGSLAPGPRNLEMRLRASDSPRRRRFTGFHEVGHTFQPGYRELTLFRCAAPSPVRRAGTDREALADVAASELLLPRDYFRPATRESEFSIGSVLELSDRFEASREASAYRFAHFWPEQTLVVILEPGLTRDEQDDPEAVAKLRVVSAWAHPHGAWPFIPKNKSAREGGALERALNGEMVREKAGLEEFGLMSEGVVEVSARVFGYRRGGESYRRVIAMFRKVGGLDG
jgi:hypothetical protein